MSVRETEQMVRRMQAEQGGKKPGVAAVDPDIQRLQDELSERLGAKVYFHHNASGKGKIQLQYNSLEELEGILAHIK
jgi:ParB family chromosome partitioning protein